MPVRDDGRIQPVLAFGGGPEERGTLRRAQPLVAVAGVPIGAGRRHIQINLPRRVRAIHQHRDIPRVAQGRNLGHRQHQSARRGDVIDHRQPRARRDRRRHRLQNRGGGRAGERNQRLGHARTGPFGDEPDCVPHRAIAMRQHQDLVIRLQAQRPQHGVASGGRVVDEHHVIPARADEPRQPIRRRPQRVRHHRPHEPGRLRLHPIAPGPLFGQHRQRRRAEGAVVDRQEIRIEPPQAAALPAQRRHLVTVAR